MNLTAFLLVGAAQAASLITEVGPVLELESSGTWARALMTDGDWRLAYATNGDFFVAPLTRGSTTADWTLDKDSRLQLTDRGNLSDHVAFATEGYMGGEFFALDTDGAVSDAFEMTGAASMAGGSLLHDQNADLTWAIGFQWQAEQMTVVGYDTTSTPWSAAENIETTVLDDGLRPYWPQGLIRVGERYLVTLMVRDDSAGWGVDSGDVYLAVFDAEWDLEELHQITALDPPNGAMRPGLARSGVQVLVTFDIDNEHSLVEVTLAEGDTADTGGPQNDDEEADSSEKTGCGCTSTGAQAGTGSLLAFRASLLAFLALCLTCCRRRSDRLHCWTHPTHQHCRTNPPPPNSSMRSSIPR
jgi:hypothetical protein